MSVGPSLGRRPRSSGGGQTLRGGLLFLMALAAPFPTLGLPLEGRLLLSPALVFGAGYALFSAFSGGLNRRHVVLGLMLVTFAATAVGRHPIETYLWSLGALTLAAAPLAAPTDSYDLVVKLRSGFIWGLYITLLIVGLQYVEQAAGIDILSGLLEQLLPAGASGTFLGVDRVRGGFFEPAHLGIYLAVSTVVVDGIRSLVRRPNLIIYVTAIFIVIIGSVTGLVVLLSYWIVRGGNLISRFVTSKDRAFIASALISVVVIVYAFFSDQVLAIVAAYASRVAEALMALTSGGIEGSEGSRANAFTALLRFFSEASFGDVMLGTGYGNLEEWLMQTYYQYGARASFARGQVDSILIAVALSTGIVGLSIYTWFSIILMKGVPREKRVAVGVLLVILNFSHGIFIYYFHWHLAFYILSSAPVARQIGQRMGRV